MRDLARFPSSLLVRLWSPAVAALIAGALMSEALNAQTPAPAGATPSPVSFTDSSAALTAAAESITAAELARHVGAITADSIGDRRTPSPGLERAARYVAAQFQALGLTSDATGFGADTVGIQYYPIPGQQRIDYDTARITFGAKPMRHDGEILTEDGYVAWRQMQVNFQTDARPASDTARLRVLALASGLAHRGVLVAGRHTPTTLRQAGLRDKFVLYVPPADIDSATRQQVIDELIAANLAVAVVSDEDSATFVHHAAIARQRPFRLVDPYMRNMRNTVPRGWGAYVRAEALRDLWSILRLDLAEIRTVAAPVIRPLPSLTGFTLDGPADTIGVKPIRAPNVVGVLAGTDSTAGYVVLSAHLDSPGAQRGAVVGENALGVAGLLALAKALSRPEVRLRRSIVFLATSGGADDFWGARYFVYESQWAPSTLVLNLTLDLLPGGARDSAQVAGLRDLELPTRADWLAAIHPELGLALADAGTAVTGKSDHFAFVEAAVPSLHVSTGGHATRLPGSERLMQQDAEHAGRVLKLVYYVTAAVANAERKPQWSAEGRRRRVEVVGD